MSPQAWSSTNRSKKLQFRALDGGIQRAYCGRYENGGLHTIHRTRLGNDIYATENTVGKNTGRINSGRESHDEDAKATYFPVSRLYSEAVLKY